MHAFEWCGLRNWPTTAKTEAENAFDVKYTTDNTLNYIKFSHKKSLCGGLSCGMHVPVPHSLPPMP